ncbi:MAG: hypothetical protein Mars2KO_06630 [Maribacter sp.]
MKKYFNTRIAIALIGLATLVSACADADKVFDEVQADVTRGAILRGFEIVSTQLVYDTAVNALVDGEEFSIVIQEQDQQNGALLSEVEVYVGYEDETEGGTDNDKSEVLLETLPASSFTIDEFGLPSRPYSISGATLQSTLGLADTDISGGDNFTVRFELVLTDGRRFTNTNNSGTITGSFFASPFLYEVVVACKPSVPTPGTWMVNTVDSYGDGWNGGSLQIVLDGGAPIEIANEDAGLAGEESVQDFTFEVPDGTETISIKYVSGDFDEEVKFTITSANSNVVSEQGPEPLVGSELLDFCPNNL